MKQPAVTILTPIYNTGIFVIKALECIKKQTYQDFEHIIIDDCSTDNSVEIVEKWIAENNYQCAFIKNKPNKGLCKTLNIGIKLAKGKYMTWLGDDEWTADFLEKRIAHFEQQNEHVGVTISDMVVIDEQSNIIAESMYEKTGVKINDVLSSIVYPAILFKAHGNTNIFAPSTIVRRSVYDNIGYYDENLFSEDVDFWFRLAAKYQFAFYPEALIYYRDRSNSLSKSIYEDGKAYRDLLIIYDKHFEQIKRASREAKLKYFRNAISNYYYNKDYQSKWFIKSFVLNRNLYSLLYVCICWLKVDPHFFEKIKSSVGSYVPGSVKSIK